LSEGVTEPLTSFPLQLLRFLRLVPPPGSGSAATRLQFLCPAGHLVSLIAPEVDYQLGGLSAVGTGTALRKALVAESPTHWRIARTAASSLVSPCPWKRPPIAEDVSRTTSVNTGG